MSALLRLLLKWHVWSIVSIPSLAACYFPDGTLASNDTPCRDDTKNSVCCGQGYACLSNGMCQATGKELQKPGATEFVRGGCTDKTWRSSSCPLFCIDPKADNTGGGMGLVKCESKKQDLYYCINSNQEDASCEEGRGLIFFPGQPSAVTTIGVSPVTSTSVESSIDSSTSADPETSALSTTGPEEAATSTTDSEVHVLTATSTESTEDNDDNNNQISTGGVAGGVVGGVAALAAVGGFLWWFLRKRRARSSSTGPLPLATEPTMHGKDYNNASGFSRGERQEVYGGFDGWGNYQHVHDLEVSRSVPQEMPTTYNQSYSR